MKKIKNGILFSLVLSILGCTSTTPPSSDITPLSTPSFRSSRVAAYSYSSIESLSIIKIPSTSFLIGNDFPSNEYGAFGVILFLNKPLNFEEKSRYIKTCEALQSTLESTEEYEGRISKKNIMPTYWLLKNRLDVKDCSTLVDNYNYARAKELLALIHELDANGPILVAWEKHPFNSSKKPQKSIIFNLSNFSEGDMSRAFKIWSLEISNSPDVWNNFYAFKTREEIRNFLEKYGQSILNFFS